jgi:hypothetical protein
MASRQHQQDRLKPKFSKIESGQQLIILALIYTVIKANLIF